MKFSVAHAVLNRDSTYKRFIPFRRNELEEVLLKDEFFAPEALTQLQQIFVFTQKIYHLRFYKKLEHVLEDFAPFDQGSDCQSVYTYSQQDLYAHEERLIEHFLEALNAANYELLTQIDLNYALNHSSIIKIKLECNLDDFKFLYVFARGEVSTMQKRRSWSFKQKERAVPTFERVALLLKFKENAYFLKKKRQSPASIEGETLIKLFKDVPKADLEIIFPNTEVKMRIQDKLLTLATLCGGTWFIFYNSQDILMTFVVFAWQLLHDSVQHWAIPTSGDIAKLLGGMTVLGFLLGFVFRQWNNYRNRKLSFTKHLVDHLYFKNLDNNTGVFYHIFSEAEKEECKEVMLTYYMLLKAEQPLSLRELDRRVELWLESQLNLMVDFDEMDAIQKVLNLKICRELPGDPDPLYEAVPLPEALLMMQEQWQS